MKDNQGKIETYDDEKDRYSRGTSIMTFYYEFIYDDYNTLYEVKRLGHSTLCFYTKSVSNFHPIILMRIIQRELSILKNV